MRATIPDYSFYRKEAVLPTVWRMPVLRCEKTRNKLPSPSKSGRPMFGRLDRMPRRNRGTIGETNYFGGDSVGANRWCQGRELDRRLLIPFEWLAAAA